MSNLIYMSGFGPTHASMAYTNYKSLRVFGKYKDHILIFTDMPELFKDAQDSSLFVKTVPDLTTRHQKGNLRLKCSDLHPFSVYKYVMYLDADVLCVNPVQEIFDYAYANLGYSMGYVRDQLPMSCKYYNVCFDDKSTLEGKLGISSAFFVIAGQVFKENMAVWQREHERMQSSHKWMHDQHSLNYVVHNNLVPSRELPEKWFEIPYYYKKQRQEDVFDARICPENKFWHFVAFNGDHKADACMKHHFNRLLDLEKFPNATINKEWPIDERLVK